MLKKLFISKVRVSILKVYTLDLDASFHVRGLVRELDEEINAVRRELINLEDAGLLKSHKDGNKLVYTLNRKCPIIWELRSMFFKDSPVGEKIRELTENIEGIQLVVLTESFIKNKYENKIDVDFLFIGNMRVKDLSNAMSEIEKDLDRQIRFSAIKKEDFDFARKKKEPFLMNILENDKIIMFGQLSDLL
jgi:DNA-binding transcriptional ArsR family regulator